MASEAFLQTSFQGAINCCPLHLPPLSFLVTWCDQIRLARSVSSGWSKLIMVFLGADQFSNQVWAHHVCVVQKVGQEAIQTVQSLGHSLCPQHKRESMRGLGVEGDVKVDFSTESIYLETVRKPAWGWNQEREAEPPEMQRQNMSPDPSPRLFFHYMSNKSPGCSDGQ